MTSNARPGGARSAAPTRAALSRGYIATVALALIDDIGRTSFSMRKLGAELGIDPMAVYRYFSDQEASSTR